ncbi:response regulator [Erythrobacter dokdonensis]|uniref:Chemotaxis response regulator n=1 Tax=Erythrobacter dokdonensis DSW-74 TaxID=1300349 RepID=A0A1A7BKB0_9SPHN|nr:response regulator [Erythrobacter dokdonensis]OBV12161.1 Chemotaxis response regulator [Erythrobacter dokdonensis DSW-74]
MQNLIKRNSGPNRRSGMAQGMEGKTLAEKLAQSERERESASVQDALSEMQARAPAAPAAARGQDDAPDTDAVVAAAKVMRDRYAGREPSASTARTCLIVDDSRVIRKVSSKIAISLGYVAIEAENGEEALARCKRAMPDLVLTDWNMPEMDGITFVTKLRSIPTPKEPVVVFCTSNGEAKDIHDGIAAGADDYIVKPFDEASLRAKLEKLGRG